MPIPNAMISSRSTEWDTPRELFDTLDREFHFTLDPCSTPQNAKCKKFFTKEQNGLFQSWARQRVFMNPPYGRSIGLWMKKTRKETEHGALVVCLVHAKTDTRWWHENVHGIADEVRFIKGRVHFEKQGVPQGPAPFASVIVIYRPRKKSHATI